MKIDKKTDDKARVIIIIFVVIVTAFAIRLSQFVINSEVEDIEPAPISAILNQFSCEDAGGIWNSCGSACRGADDETVCIQVCVEQCECRSNNECPAGYACGDYIEETGICILEE